MPNLYAGVPAHRWVTLIAFFVVLLADAALASTSAPSASNSWLYQAKRPLILAHRGSRYLNPENTLPAFHSALQLGADVLEMDVRLTADNRLVVFHDENVNRTTEGYGLVRQKTLAEMLALDAGYRYTHDGGLSYPYRDGGVAGPHPLRVPTFDQFLDAFPDQWINVEIKDRERLAAELTWQHLQRQPNYSSRFVVASRYCDIIDHFRNITQGAIATAACETEATNMRIKILLGSAANTLDYCLGLRLPPAEVYQLPTRAEMIDYLHSIGAKVHYWVVNDARYMQRLLAKGIDGLITDRPDVAYAVWQQMGYDMPGAALDSAQADGLVGSNQQQQQRWRHFEPLAQAEELHECVTLVCRYFAFGLGAVYFLVFVILALLALAVCLARRLYSAIRTTRKRSSSSSSTSRSGNKVKRA
ncbi:glycerophosphodiester phosphodiesterase family protein [Acanthamoeba castellanii str. Neff]|uniref:Glycerophosphodiester phosphodiesterase family protein n=1 Tax=Acanthamoeba castellanii (strain ATCC 30010 / Neff) TaxID=1257118 RepID=L8GEW1_ACACF|nr:glycerophosphodiester phosphodiesterase family protein [Acanthamoeba castellanii str. Neff]ELR11273.1 glycerophosphodiester phosphodiesterase family protein [Acanthamoeba castellanii str. Neff]